MRRNFGKRRIERGKSLWHSRSPAAEGAEVPDRPSTKTGAVVSDHDGACPSVSLLDDSVISLYVQAALLQVLWTSVRPQSPSRFVPASLVFRRRT